MFTIQYTYVGKNYKDHVTLGEFIVSKFLSIISHRFSSGSGFYGRNSHDNRNYETFLLIFFCIAFNITILLLIFYFSTVASFVLVGLISDGLELSLGYFLVFVPYLTVLAWMPAHFALVLSVTMVIIKLHFNSQETHSI
eukprot:gene3586-6321_t